jgi:hypothetical protein
VATADSNVAARSSVFSEYARRYSRLLYALVRCEGKAPRGRAWQEIQPEDVELAAGKWSEWGTRWNLGIVCGPSGLAILDVDRDDAHEATEELLGGWPTTPVVVTGSGKLHVYFRDPGGLEKRERDGFELRVGAHHVLAPPSIHPDSGRLYRWLRPPWAVELAELPRSLIDFFAADTPKPKAEPVSEAIPEGGRHRTLASLAGTYRRRGLGEEEIAVALMTTNTIRCRPPLPEDEVVALARDVVKRYDPVPPDREQDRLHVEAERLLARDGNVPREPTAPRRRQREIHRRLLSTVTARRVELLIGKLPLSAFSAYVGIGGLGKTSVALADAAEVTRAGGDVLWISYEDTAEYVLRPRLEALGADLDRVHELTLDPAEGLISFPRDLEEVERQAQETNARLLVVDPLSAALDLKLDSHKDRDVRVVIAGLASLAERCSLAALGITHLNKGASTEAYLRVSGSIATYNAARALWTLTPDPQDPDRLRLLCQHKANWTALAPVERWRVLPVTLDGGIETAVMEFVEIAADVSRDDVLVSATVEKRSEAETLIVAELVPGPRPSADVKAAGARRGISERTMKRAAQELDVEIEQRSTPTGRVTFWALPEGVGPVLNTEVGPSPPDRMVEPNRGGSGHERHLRPDPTPLTTSCELHPGSHEVLKRAAGLVYLACGCHQLDAADERQEGVHDDHQETA